MKKLVIFDVDNTIVDGQSQRLLLSYLFRQKKVSIYYYVSVLLWFIAYKLRIVHNPRKVISFAYSFLKGKSREEVDELLGDFFEKMLKVHIFPEALKAIKEHKDVHDQVIIISNAPSIVVKPLAAYLGIETYFCTQLEIAQNGLYTGAVLGDIMYGDNKRDAVIHFGEQNGFDLSQAYAYGDHISDISVLESVGHPIAVNPDALLKALALKKGWEIHNWHL
ncbi:MAG TPA: HAD-IB family hydrolase [Candidatus Paceibacterota bacterium]|jgi:HAD superfamily hydrolase (TIGR01490 family)|nr:HAD-IB family hydrolase [Candidatus Paceibacterota bacterium]